MINIEAQLVAMAHAGRCKRILFQHNRFVDVDVLCCIYFLYILVRIPPRLDTLENTMKLSSMIVQALWNTKSPLLQLPHITESHLRFFETKKVGRSVMFI
jgi:hypothetical protein